jgi:hypothetical protein
MYFLLIFFQGVKSETAEGKALLKASPKPNNADINHVKNVGTSIDAILEDIKKDNMELYELLYQ